MNQIAPPVLLALLLATPLAAQTLPPGFVRLAGIVPEIVQDIRYATPDNFTGRAVAGYEVPDCWLRKEAAAALAGVALDMAKTGWRVVVYDCYRPKRAVAAFVAWASDPAEQSRKAEFYPRIDKTQLFQRGYIARISAHSTGLAVDAGALPVDPKIAQDIDFGTPFDRFDPRSATASPGISATAKANRQKLAAAFAAHGFANYSGEWWHFALRLPGKATAYDMPISRQK